MAWMVEPLRGIGAFGTVGTVDGTVGTVDGTVETVVTVVGSTGTVGTVVARSCPNIEINPLTKACAEAGPLGDATR
jgi:hypothetical protein